MSTSTVLGGAARALDFAEHILGADDRHTWGVIVPDSLIPSTARPSAAQGSCQVGISLPHSVTRRYG